jgi:glycosyltransferase involved in cell wall biosynthesis
MKYAIIIAAKNEENFLPQVLESILNQELKPVKCLVINDNSNDNTAVIIDSYVKKDPLFLNYDLKGDSKKYILGSHIVDIFNKGIQILEEMQMNFDWIVKMDADIEFDKNMFSQIAAHAIQEKYGILSPSPFHYHKGKKMELLSPQWHTFGDCKIYNKECLQDIGGLKYGYGWDCADNIMAMEKGWKTKVFRDISYKHNRLIGKYSKKEARIRQGIGAYKLGYHILYLKLKGIHDFVVRPFLIGSFYYWYGFLKALFTCEPQILNKNQKKLLRKLFWQSISERMNKNGFYIFQIFSVIRKEKRQLKGNNFCQLIC